MICPLASSIDFLFRKFIQSFAINKNMIREMRLVLRRIRRSICRCAQNRQNEGHLCYYLLYPWWSFKTVHYANQWLGKCVRVVLVVNIMIHRQILVQILRYLVTRSCILSRHVQRHVYVYYRTKQRIIDNNSLRTYVVAQLLDILAESSTQTRPRECQVCLTLLGRPEYDH